VEAGLAGAITSEFKVAFAFGFAEAASAGFLPVLVAVPGCRSVLGACVDRGMFIAEDAMSG
jgi:hypothetical protein